MIEQGDINLLRNSLCFPIPPLNDSSLIFPVNLRHSFYHDFPLSLCACVPAHKDRQRAYYRHSTGINPTKLIACRLQQS